MRAKLNALFLMSVLLLGLVGYPSSQLNFENNINVYDNSLFSFSSLAYADEDEEEDEREEEEEHEEEREDEENEDEDEFKIKGIVELIDLISQSITLDNGKVIFVDEDTEFEHFDSLSDLQDFAVEVEVVLSNSSYVATEIEIEDEHDDEGEDEHDEGEEFEEDEESEDELEIEIEVEDGVAKVKVKYNDQKHKFLVTGDVSEGAIAAEILGLPDFPLDTVDAIKEIWDFEDEDEHKSSKTIHEHEKESTQTALDLIQELHEKIEQLEDRIQTLLEKYESGEYFGTVPEADSEIRSYTITFDGFATSMDDESMVDAEGQIYIENLLTVDDSISKFRVTGGEISIDSTFYDIAFGKARVSSTGPSGEKDTIVLLGQVIDFTNPDDDSTTLKLVINSETSLEGDFGLESVNIEILPQSKIAGQWYLSGSGELFLLEG